MDNATAARDEHLERLLGARRIVVTRAGAAGEVLVKRLQTLGATVLHYPAISFEPPRDTLAFRESMRTVAAQDWLVFTSANAVQAVAQQLHDLFGTYAVPLPPIAVVGSATAAAVESFGWAVQFMPTRSSGATLALELPIQDGARVMLPRADIASADVPVALRERGCTVLEVVAYRTLTHPMLAQSKLLRASEKIDALTFTSPSTLSGFLELAAASSWDIRDAQRTGRLMIVCIGNTTANAIHQQNLIVNAVAKEPTVESLIDALALCFRPRHDLTRRIRPAPQQQ